MYKNGIFGHRYKGYYIIKGESKGKFAIWNEEKTVFRENILDYDDCEWIIDKETADLSTQVMIKMLYGKEIYELSEAFVKIMQKSWETPLTEEEKNLYKWVEKIRARKADERKF